MPSLTRAAERGFLLTLLLPVLALFLLFLVGSLRFAAREQARVALQSRLDVCAVQAATARERFYGRLAKANEGVNDTKIAIYALRAAALIPGVGEGAIAAEEPLLLLNDTLAAAEDALVVVSEAEELAKLRCAPTRYSAESALCVATPPVGLALVREKTLFPDIKGTLRHKAEGRKLAQIRCASLSGLSTTLEITGDDALRQWKGYEDAYKNLF